jgi:hypothetical protein
MEDELRSIKAPIVASIPRRQVIAVAVETKSKSKIEPIEKIESMQCLGFDSL